jgi:hypothetical protein
MMSSTQPSVETPLLPGVLKVRESSGFPVSSGGQPCLALVQPKSSFTGEATIRAASIVDRTQSHLKKRLTWPGQWQYRRSKTDPEALGRRVKSAPDLSLSGPKWTRFIVRPRRNLRVTVVRCARMKRRWRVATVRLIRLTVLLLVIIAAGCASTRTAPESANFVQPHEVTIEEACGNPTRFPLSRECVDTMYARCTIAGGFCAP